MAKLEEMKVGEVYKNEYGNCRTVLFVDDKTCYAQLENLTYRYQYLPNEVKDWTLVKPERELWFWRISSDMGWRSTDRMYCDEGIDSKGNNFYKWHSLEKEKLTALGSVKVGK